MTSYAPDSCCPRNENPGLCMTCVQYSSAALFMAATCTDAANATTAATRHAAATPIIVHVRLEIFPLRGSMQCFTATTESPSMAATSTALALLLMIDADIDVPS